MDTRQAGSSETQPLFTHMDDRQQVEQDWRTWFNTPEYPKLAKQISFLTYRLGLGGWDEELLQDTLLVLYEKYLLTGRYERSRGSLVTLGSRIAFNLACHLLSQLKWEDEMPGIQDLQGDEDEAEWDFCDPQASDPQQQAEQADELWAIDQARVQARISQRDWDIFLLDKVHGVDQEEIARHKGLTGGNVRVIILRVKRKIACHLSDLKGGATPAADRPAG